MRSSCVTLYRLASTSCMLWPSPPKTLYEKPSTFHNAHLSMRSSRVAVYRLASTSCMPPVLTPKTLYDKPSAFHNAHLSMRSSRVALYRLASTSCMPPNSLLSISTQWAMPSFPRMSSTYLQHKLCVMPQAQVSHESPHCT